MLKELFSPPDIRRFDYVKISSYTDVSAQEQYEQKEPAGTEKNLVDPVVLKNHVEWAWQLKLEDVVFDTEAVAEIFRESIRLRQKYDQAQDVPLVHSDIHDKLARLSASFAVMSHSTDDKGLVHVKSEHVIFMVGFIDYTYSGPNMRLDVYAKTKRRIVEVPEQEFHEVYTWLTDRPNSSNRLNSELSKQLIELLAKECPIKNGKIQEKLSIGKDALAERIRFLKEHGLVTLGYQGV